MRNTLHEALIGYRERMDKIVAELVKANQLTADEALTRYATQHKGRPAAMLRFAAQGAPAEVPPLVAAKQYEQAMEAEWRKRVAPRPANSEQ